MSYHDKSTIKHPEIRKDTGKDCGNKLIKNKKSIEISNLFF